MSRILSIDNIRLFLNTLSHVQAGIFPGPCYRVSNMSHIRPMVGFDTMRKFVGLTHLIKLVL
jgi:hypothetical protein